MANTPWWETVGRTAFPFVNLFDNWGGTGFMNSAPKATDPAKDTIRNTALPYQPQMDAQMEMMNELIQQLAASKPPQQDLTGASEMARQASARRGLSGGMAAGLETRATGHVQSEFARTRASQLQGLLGLSTNTILGAQGAEAQRRMYMAQLKQAAEQGDADAMSALMEMLFGVGGAIAGGAVGGPPGAAMGFQAGRGLGSAFGT